MSAVCAAGVMSILQRWQVRVDGHVVCSVTGLNLLDAAAAIHRSLELADGVQVRLHLNQHDLSPTGRGEVCRPDGSLYRPFQLIRLGDTADRAAA